MTVPCTARAKDGGWTCTFPGWSVVSHVPLHEGEDSSTLHLEGSLADGTAFQSDAAAAVVVHD